MSFVDQFDNAISGTTFDATRDEPNVRELFLSDSRTVKLERKDPYGFVHIVWNKGAAPGNLESVFTSFSDAKKAIEMYLATETYNTELVIEPVVKAVSLITKKVV